MDLERVPSGAQTNNSQRANDPEVPSSKTMSDDRREGLYSAEGCHLTKQLQLWSCEQLRAVAVGVSDAEISCGLLSTQE
jgi:hypothetical protein